MCMLRKSQTLLDWNGIFGGLGSFGFFGIFKFIDKNFVKIKGVKVSIPTALFKMHLNVYEIRSDQGSNNCSSCPR